MTFSIHINHCSTSEQRNSQPEVCKGGDYQYYILIPDRNIRGYTPWTGSTTFLGTSFSTQQHHKSSISISKAYKMFTTQKSAYCWHAVAKFMWLLSHTAERLDENILLSIKIPSLQGHMIGYYVVTCKMNTHLHYGVGIRMNKVILKNKILAVIKV